MRTTLLALLMTAACGKEHAQCEKFVDLAFKCDEDLKSSTAEDKKTAKLMMGSMCEEAFKNDTGSVPSESRKMVSEMYTELRKRADCASKAKTCDQYEVCAPD